MTESDAFAIELDNGGAGSISARVFGGSGRPLGSISLGPDPVDVSEEARLEARNAGLRAAAAHSESR